MNSAGLYLGVDGGQSSTTAVIGDSSGYVLGVGTGGPCNHVGAAEGASKLRRTLFECLGKACEHADLNIQNVFFQSACFGMSGGPADKEQLLSEVLRTRKLLVTDDAVIALSGALGGAPGIVTIAGTGSIAVGRNAFGKRARAGGWGYIFGDEGGAFDIVRQALRAALRDEEGWGPTTLLRAALLGVANESDVNSLLHAFYTLEWPRSRIAALAPVVTKVAEEGDAVAKLILRTAAEQLASMAQAVRHQLWEQDGNATFSFVGGVFQSQLVSEHFRSVIESQSGCLVARPLFSAAVGALLEAYRSDGISPEPDKLLTSNF